MWVRYRVQGNFSVGVLRSGGVAEWGNGILMSQYGGFAMCISCDVCGVAVVTVAKSLWQNLMNKCFSGVVS